MLNTYGNQRIRNEMNVKRKESLAKVAKMKDRTQMEQATAGPPKQDTVDPH